MDKNGLLIEANQVPSSILSTLNDMRKDGTWCDLKLEIPSESGDRTIFPVHACVVAAASKSLAVIVNRRLKEAVLENLNSHFVSLCINYIYGKGIFVLFNDIPHLLRCAEELELSGLVEICKTRLDCKKMAVKEESDHCIGLQETETCTEQTVHVKLELPEEMLEIHTMENLIDTTDDSKQGPTNINHMDDIACQKELRVELTEPVKKTKLYSCSQCPLKFNRLDLLEQHEQKHREGAAVPSLLQCSSCNFCASTRREASQHKAWHCRTNEHRCDTCQLAFKVESDLSNHSGTKRHLDMSSKIVKNSDSRISAAEDVSLCFLNEMPEVLTDAELQKLHDAKLSPQRFFDIESSVSGTETREVGSDTTSANVTDDEAHFDSEDAIETPLTDNNACPKVRKRKRLNLDSSPINNKTITQITEGYASSESKVKQKIDKRKLRRRRFLSSCTGVKKHKFAKSDGQLVEECDFDDTADALGVPAEIRPLLAPDKWPDYLKRGQFKHRPLAAYKVYYINQYKEYTCEACGDVIRGKQCYTAHRRKEKGLYVHCSFCGKGFSSQGSLKTHEMRHKNQKDVKCKLCDFRCYFNHTLKKHMQNLHGELGGPTLHLCSQCPKTFKSAQSLTIHEMRVHKKDEWQNKEHCTLCNYEGFSKRDVMLHMAKHSKEKPHICYICQRYAFKRVKELNKHIRSVHNQEPRFRQYKSLADKDSAVEITSEPLTLLPRLPKIPKVSKCSHCDYTATNPQNMKAHVVIHSDERPFPCPVCGMGFKRKNVMVRHAWRLHKIDLRSVCYEYTNSGKKKRRELEQKLILLETPSQIQPLVNDGEFEIEMLHDVSEQQDVQQAFYAAVGDDGQAMYTSVVDDGHTIYTNIADESQGMYRTIGDAPLDEDQPVVLKAQDDTYIQNLQLLSGESSSNVDINVIREVVVENNASIYTGDVLQEAGTSSHTISVPITDAAGLTAETQIVIDSNVLKSMGLENISSAQLKIIGDSDS